MSDQKLIEEIAEKYGRLPMEFCATTATPIVLDMSVRMKAALTEFAQRSAAPYVPPVVAGNSTNAITGNISFKSEAASPTTPPAAGMVIGLRQASELLKRNGFNSYKVIDKQIEVLLAASGKGE